MKRPQDGAEQLGAGELEPGVTVLVANSTRRRSLVNWRLTADIMIRLSISQVLLYEARRVPLRRCPISKIHGHGVQAASSHSG